MHPHPGEKAPAKGVELADGGQFAAHLNGVQGNASVAERLSERLGRAGVHYVWVMLALTFLTMLATSATMGMAGVLMRPLQGVSARYLVTLAFFAAIVLAGFFAWGWQVNHGIGVSGLRRPVFWGFYITNFVFWIGLSHAGTLISAILRLANATWRRPVTRCA